MRPARNLVLVGPFGSGKSTLAALVSGETGAEVVELGEIVRAKARSEAFEGPIIRFAEQQFERRGELWVVDAATTEYGLERGGSVVVGPRTLAEVEFLVAQTGALVVGLTADRAIRLARRMAQMRPSEGSPTKLAERDRLEHEWGVIDCLQLAEFVVNTSQTSVLLALSRVVAAWALGPTTAIAQ